MEPCSVRRQVCIRTESRPLTPAGLIEYLRRAPSPCPSPLLPLLRSTPEFPQYYGAPQHNDDYHLKLGKMTNPATRYAMGLLSILEAPQSVNVLDV